LPPAFTRYCARTESGKQACETAKAMSLYNKSKKQSNGLNNKYITQLVRLRKSVRPELVEG
jgi:hypothetical protein